MNMLIEISNKKEEYICLVEATSISRTKSHEWKHAEKQNCCNLFLSKL